MQEYLPPATKLGQGYVFTRVCDSVHGGVSASVHAGMHPPGGHPLGRHPPQEDTRKTPQEDTRNPPLGAVHAGRYGQQAGGIHPTGMHTC